MKSMYWRFDQGQIPCSGSYLVTVDGKVEVRYYDKEHRAWGVFTDASVVKAWMPLPEPFEYRK